jgi:hypothetical protein
MEKSERFFLFKFLNAAYRLSIVENAVNTQNIIAKMTKVFRYGINSGNRLVRLKSELGTLKTFIEIYNISTGKNYAIICDDISVEAANAYIPSYAVIGIISDALMESEETRETGTNFGKIKAYVKNNHVYIDIFLSCIKRTDNLAFPITGIRGNCESLCITDAEESGVKGVMINIEFSS